MPIQVHVACDNTQLSDTIIALLGECELGCEVSAGRLAREYANALDGTHFDVVVLADLSGGYVFRHATSYRRMANKETAFIGFCTTDGQAEEYLLAGIEVLANLATETGVSLCEKVKLAHGNGSGR